jgi:uncharacterized protein
MPRAAASIIVKFHLTRPDGRNLITGYGETYVAVNGQRLATSVIVLPDRLTPWEVRTHAALTPSALAALAALPMEILLLGTGARQHFPHPSLTQPLRDAGIGIEVMTTSAACRTYNILLSEDRRVAAALILPGAD